MKKFILKGFLMLFMVLISLGSLCASLYIIPRDEGRYMAANIIKQNLLRTTKSPKLMLIGGSNLAFGIDSKLMEKYLMTGVVNMGLHASLGLRFMFEEVKPFLTKGDLVIVVPEYEHFYEAETDGDGNTLADLLYSNSEAIRFVTTLSQYNKLASAFPYWAVKYQIFRLINTDSGGIYRRASFDEKGDISVPRKKGEINFDNEATFSGKIRNDAIILINEFGEYASEKGAVVLFSFPSFPRSEYVRNKAPITELKTELEERLKVKIINTPQENIFPDDYFFNSRYHMNDEGVEIRTHQFITEITNFFKR